MNELQVNQILTEIAQSNFSVFILTGSLQHYLVLIILVDEEKGVILLMRNFCHSDRCQNGKYSGNVSFWEVGKLVLNPTHIHK